MSRGQTTSIPAVPLRTPLLDSDGNLSRTWIVFFENLGRNATVTPIHEVPTGPIDGVNRVFYLTREPLAGWLVLDLDNALEDPIADYGLLGNAITYAIAPQIGDAHHAWYLVGIGAAAATVPVTAAITPVTLVTTPGIGKALFIGASAPPANWQTSAYSDAAWTAWVDQTLAHVALPIAGTGWITDSAVNRGANTDSLFRAQFVVGAGAISGGVLTMLFDDTVTEVWVNGIAQSNSSPVSIAASALVTGTNLIAIRVRNLFAASPLSLDFSLVIS